MAIWHAVEGDWQPPLSGPRNRFESTGTRVSGAANGSLSALPQGVAAGRDNWRLEAPEEVARPAFLRSAALRRSRPGKRMEHEAARPPTWAASGRNPSGG